MKLVIGHLYYDLMNLYGENGNIKVLEKQLKEQGSRFKRDRQWNTRRKRNFMQCSKKLSKATKSTQAKFTINKKTT